MADGWAALARVASTALATPYADPAGYQLQRFTQQVLWGQPSADAPLDRKQAMALPPLARARHLLCSTAARTPLQVLGRVDDRSQPIEDQPSWLVPIDAAQMPAYHRMTWTVDDLLFYGASVWLAQLGADGFPLQLDRLPQEEWTLATDGTLLDVDGQPLPARGTVFIPGPHEGILNFGQDALRLSRDLNADAREQAARPFRLELHQTSDAALTRAERAELVADARAALLQNQGILFTNAALEAKVHPLQASDLLTQGRESSARDLARLADVPAGMIDAPSGDSMTYANVRQRLTEFLTFGASSYLGAITARLSMGDVTPRGQLVAFDIPSVLRELSEEGLPA